MPDCRNCGKHVSEGAPYCLSCGAVQTPPEDAPHQSPPAVPDAPQAAAPVFAAQPPAAPPPPAAPAPPWPSTTVGAAPPPDEVQPPPPGGYAAPETNAASVPPPPVSGAAAGPYSPQPAGPRGPVPTPARSGLPGWAIALIIAAVVLVVAVPIAIVVVSFATIGSVVEDVAPMIDDQIRLANERSVRDGVTSIQAGVEAWAADHGGRYPAAARVDGAGLVSPAGLSYVDPWPVNPYAGGSMTQGTGEGQFLYVRGSKGKSYTLAGYGAGGNVIISLP